jgi:hypothetical protein
MIRQKGGKMPQHILLQSFIGPSDYVYIVTCSGRPLDLTEAKQAGLTDDQTLRRHKKSEYTHEWFEVNPGDWIEVELIGEEFDEENLHARFTVPENGLADPPQKLDDERTHNMLHEYLISVCSYEELPESLDNV